MYCVLYWSRAIVIKYSKETKNVPVFHYLNIDICTLKSSLCILLLLLLLLLLISIPVKQ